MNWKKAKKDFLLASISHFIYKVTGYLVLTILTRYLAKGDMGEFFFAASLASFFALFTQLGTDNYLIREVAVKPGMVLQNFSEVISLRLVLLAFYIFLLNGFTLIIKPGIAETVFLTSIYVLLEQFYFTFGSLFVGVKLIKYNVISGVGSRVALAGLIFLIVKLHGSMPMIICCYITANTLLVGTAFIAFRRKIGKFRIIFQSDTAWKVIRLSFPFFILSVLSLVHFKIDSLMLGFMKSYTTVASYESAYKLFEASQFLTVPFGLIFLPVFSEMAVSEKWNEILALINKLTLVLLIIGFAAAVIVIASAGFIIPFVFGSKYSDSVSILKILYLTVPVYYLVNFYSMLSRSVYLEKKAIKVFLLCTVLNIGLNCIAIPVWSASGAAWATFTTETILALLLVRLNVRELRVLNSKEPVKLSEVPDNA